MNRLFTVVGLLVVAAVSTLAFRVAMPGLRTAALAADSSSNASPATGEQAPGEPVQVEQDAGKSSAQAAAQEQPVTYRVRQIVRLDEIQSGAKNVRMWVSIPDDEAYQRVLDFDVVSAPGKWSIASDAEHRGRFLRVDVKNPDASLEVEVEFVVTRDPVHVTIDPQRVGPLSEGLHKALAEYLVFDSPHMEVNNQILDMADAVCGDEKNVAVQAAMLLEHVAKVADHYSYSKDPNMPHCGIGDAGNCLAQGGGCCTDMHSLFIALARARSIPARLNMGYRLQEKNRGLLTDPGYRCWVEYYIPNYGWISADLVEADAPNGLGKARWTTGLTARRVWLNQGRQFKLADDLAVGLVNHMSIAYAEIDGVPARLLPEGKLKPQISRQVMFTELSADK